MSLATGLRDGRAFLNVTLNRMLRPAMNIRQIEAFCAVMQSGSVSGAARLLAISPPAVSRMLRHTEDRLGYALFDRQGGRLMPTREAQTLYTEAKKALGGMRRVAELAEAIGGSSPGLLRVAANPSFGASLLPAAVGEFRRRWPEVRLEINTTAHQAVVDRMVLRQADLGLTQFRARHPPLWEERLGRLPMCVALPPDSPLARRSVVRLEDLRGLKLIGYRADTPIGDAVNGHLQAAGFDQPADIVVRYPMIACMFVAAGLGTAVVDPLMALEPQRWRISFRPLEHAPVSEIWLLGHAGNPPDQAGRGFAQAIRTILTATISNFPFL